MAKNRSLIIAIIGIVALAAVYGAIFSGDLSGAATTVCRETDGGKNYLVAGNTTVGRTTSKDACVDNTRLKEFYCNRNKIDSTTYNCALQNKVCKNGACVACVDSDGKNFYTKGYVKYLGSTSWDKCYDPNSGQTVNKSNWLAEMYCTDNGQAGGQTQTPCANGCVNGACVKGDCDIEDILTYGSYATKTYTVNGFDYEITLIIVDAYKNTAKFSVNGVVTNEIAVGASFVQGFKIRVASITPDGRGGFTVIFCFKGETTEPPTPPPYPCPVGGISDTLRDGETKAYTINGLDYEITAVFIDSHDHTAKFQVNGVITKALTINEYAVTGDSILRVSEIMANQREGMATFCFAETTEPETHPYTCEGEGVVDNLKDGETKTYTLNGFDYEVTAVFITSEQYRAKFSVNGLLTDELSNGESAIIESANIRVLEVMTNERGGMVTFCLISTESAQCTDSDGGRVYDVVGTTSALGATVTDTCASPTSVNENYCDFAIAPKQKFILGPSNSQFIYQSYSPTNKRITIEEVNVGTTIWDVTADGSFTIVTGGKEYQFHLDNMYSSDSPMESDVGGLILVERVNCGLPGCFAGACNFTGNACEESDGGKNYYQKGTIIQVMNGNKGSVVDFCRQDCVDPYMQNCTNTGAVVEHYCRPDGSGYIDFVDYPCSQGCSDGACIGPDLESYPYPFIYNGALNTNIVIAAQAPTSDVVAAIDIAAGLKVLTSGGQLPVGITILDQDVTLPAAMNLISIGNACYNTVTAALMGYPADCTEGLLSNSGMLRLFSNEWGYSQLVVAGYDETQLKGAARVLKEYGDYALRGTWIDVFTSSDLSSITVLQHNQCTDSDGGRNYYVKGTIEGPKLTTREKPVDYCVDYSQGGNTLVEYQCLSGGLSSESYVCPHGCSNGACLNDTVHVCGDGVRYQMYEQCDGADLGPNTCIGSGFIGGTLRCKADCTLDTTGCISPGWCNDTDGGRNYNVKGYVIGTIIQSDGNAYPYNFPDLCWKGNGTVKQQMISCTSTDVGCELVERECVNQNYMRGDYNNVAVPVTTGYYCYDGALHMLV